jgi:hypothetical protein
MSHTHVAHDQPAVRRKPGPKPQYGEKAIPRMVYWPPPLIERLDEDAATRAKEAGRTSACNASKLIVAIVAAHYGMEIPGSGVRGGETDDLREPDLEVAAAE